MIKLFSKSKILFSLCVLSSLAFLVFSFNKNDKAQYVEAATTSCKGPADVMLIIDRSGTMGNNLKFSNAKSESVNFVDKLFSAIPEGGPTGFNYHQIGLVAFNQLTATVNLTQSGDEIKNSINDPEGILGDSYPIGSRNTDTAIQQARLKLGLENGGNPFATKTMIILTDGAPNNLDAAKTQVVFAKDNDIRVISIGLELDAIEDGTIEDAKEFIKYASSSPADCYYIYDSGDELENCTSISLDELGVTLNGIYGSITAAVCDESSPTISILRKPSGTLYPNIDKLTITSEAIDDIGFKSHEIIWSDDWPNNLQTVGCANLLGTTVSCGASECIKISCDTEELGPFSAGKMVSYRSIVVDTNDNEVNINPPETVTVASVSLSVPSLFRRNTDNDIEMVISNYGGGDDLFISIDAPALEGIEIDKASITNCSDSGNTRTCNYNFNPDCSWKDGITDGVANDINVNVYVYAENVNMGTRQIASSENNSLVSYFEGKDWSGTCSDGKNNDCNYDVLDDPIIDLEEMLCDIVGPGIGVSRLPSDAIYDFESDGTTPMLVTINSDATDDLAHNNGIKQHTIYYRENGGVWQTAFNCNDANVDNLCDEDTSQNVANISRSIGSFAAGTKIDYYSVAVDYSGNDNSNSTDIKSFIVRNRECGGVSDLGDCLVTENAKCCGEVCNAIISNPNLYDTDFCVEEICNGIFWEQGSANDDVICSASGTTECHSFSDLYGSPPGIPPYFYDGGCEERDYICSSGYCIYDVINRNEDHCIGEGSLILNDYECVGNSCVLDPSPAIGNDVCDVSLDYLSVNAYNSDNIFICGSSGAATGEVLNNLTSYISLRSTTYDENDISEQKIYWKKSTDADFSVNNHDVSLCGDNILNPCNYSQDTGPFNIGEIIEFYASSKDDSPNQTERTTDIYSFTVHNSECYDIPGGDKPDLTFCDSENGRCCGGSCDSSVSSTSYDKKCRVDSCSGTNWVYAAGNEGVSCGSADSCFDYYSPNISFYSGCITGGNKCSSGSCVISSSLTSTPICNGNLLTNYNCDPNNATGTCQPKDSDIDCSVVGNYDSDSVDCNCDCNGYDLEEKVYSSLSFDGVDDYVDCGDIDALDIADNFTVEFWFKRNSDIEANSNHNISNVMFAQASDPDNDNIEIGTDNTYLEIYLDTASYDATLTYDAGIQNDVWYHFVFTYDSDKAEEAKLYFDGVNIKAWNNWGGALDNSSTSPVTIGNTAHEETPFNGLIDDVRIYNRVLYPEEITDQYNGIFADDTGLIGYWNFDEGTGVAADDISSNNNDGILKNGPEWMKHYNGSVVGPNGNVPENWQACTDGKDNDCDGIYDEYAGAVSDCDGDVFAVSATASAKNRNGVEVSNLFATDSSITIYDSDIRETANEFTIEADATDDFSIVQLIIEWTTDNWTTTKDETCNNTGSCEVCVEGGACGVGHDDILLSSLSADKIFKFKVCAVDGSANNNQKCTIEYSIEIKNSNAVPVITPLTVVEPDFCSERLKYILKWEFDDDGDAQNNFEIQIKENDFSSPGNLIIDKSFDLPNLFYQINSDDFETGESIEYGEGEYYWRVKVTDDRESGYEQTTQWEVGPVFTTPLYEYPEVDFIVTPDYSDPCLYETDHMGAVVTCDWGENITFSPATSSIFVECTSSGNEQCLTTVSAKCDTTNRVCTSCTDDLECARFNAGEITYSCLTGICEVSAGLCTTNNDCLAVNFARCDTGLCVTCDNDSQCGKFNAGNIDSGLLGNVSSGSSDTLTDSSKSWLVDEWAGGAVKIVLGTGAGQIKSIISNTDKEITVDSSWTVIPDSLSEYRIIKYFCNNEGSCENKERYKWWFYDSVIDPDSRDLNPINNYIESEVNNHDITFEIRDIMNNSCRKIKNIRLGGREYPKWNEVAPHN